ncbi:MAG: hypothetical protein PVH88_20205 [Ignavibacteria bacterium]|jgi:hypothetical protein
MPSPKVILPYILIILTACSLVPENDNVIEVGDHKTSIKEFQSRLNNIPQTLKLPVNELKENLAATLIAETVFSIDKRLQNKLNTFLSDVIGNYEIEINRDALEKVEYFGGNMGVKKTHFPLRSAVPMFLIFDHNAKWYQCLTD